MLQESQWPPIRMDGATANANRKGFVDAAVWMLCLERVPGPHHRRGDASHLRSSSQGRPMNVVRSEPRARHLTPLPDAGDAGPSGPRKARAGLAAYKAWHRTPCGFGKPAERSPGPLARRRLGLPNARAPGRSQGFVDAACLDALPRAHTRASAPAPVIAGAGNVPFFYGSFLALFSPAPRLQCPFFPVGLIEVHG